MKIKLLAGLAMSTMLFGCANTADLEAQVSSLSNKVDTLSTQIGSLRADHDKMGSDIKAAKNAAMDAQDEAARANSRIDAMATNYRKK
ncbi:Lpp/OprI family alanine-zipper lipoprotein [uncultured Ferrimonas sp.]|uniref:Lpp/OprI family alanine-zipper lipoprotein n=1 Tax=uncultured Ferrimonas sp. TaxID=432640 RepID=UPI00263891B4|nr:Lpp/OprI family alanine-zipper lipoprotein [uncultured Ferrimonas sp.]